MALTPPKEAPGEYTSDQEASASVLSTIALSVPAYTVVGTDGSTSSTWTEPAVPGQVRAVQLEPPSRLLNK
jgi:hypothetical protein